MPARPVASATISFGLVSIPVKLFTSTETAETISFRMLHETCKTPVKYQYWCPQDEEVVPRDDIVKGYEFRKGQFVLFTQEELKALEEEATKAIAIEEFIPLDKIDPIYFDKGYYLGADKGGGRAYTLLAEAMRQKRLAGLARYAARGKQYLVMLRATEDGLVMQQLRYADEVRSFADVPVDAASEVKEAELTLALQLIEQTVTEEFHPEKYEDEVKQRMQEIIQKKIEGEEVAFAPAESPKAQVIDLMEALKASLGEDAEAGGRSSPKAAPQRAEKRGSGRRRASS